MRQVPLKVCRSQHSAVRRYVMATGIVCALFLHTLSALANGGQLRVDGEPVGPYRLYVFTDPTPLREGLADVSVIVEDAQTFETRFDVTVDITAESLEHDLPLVSGRTSREQADDPNIYQAAELDLPRSGNWRFTVTLTDDTGEVGSVTFDARASAERNIGWLPLVLAVIALPLIFGAIWFFAVNRDDDESMEDAEAS
jgi:hypothetical protein